MPAVSGVTRISAVSGVPAATVAEEVPVSCQTTWTIAVAEAVDAIANRAIAASPLTSRLSTTLESLPENPLGNPGPNRCMLLPPPPLRPCSAADPLTRLTLAPGPGLYPLYLMAAHLAPWEVASKGRMCQESRSQEPSGERAALG